MCDFRDENGEAPPSAGGVSGFVDQFVVAMTNSRIYDASHPRVRASIEVLEKTLDAQFRELGRDTFWVGAADGYLFFDERPLLAASRSAPRLLAILARLESGGIAFDRGTDADDLSGLIRFFQDEKQVVAGVDEANEALRSLGCRHVRLLSGYHVLDGINGVEDFAGTLLGRPDVPAAVNRDHMLDIPRRLHESLFDHLTNVATRVVRGDSLDLTETHQAVERILTQLMEDATSMLSVSHYEVTEADQFQFRHSIRVACIALDFARHLTDDVELLHRIGTAALLHDVGKARVPFEVLHCRSRLSKEQFAAMQLHPEHGARILLDLSNADPLAITVSFMHHRTSEGEGYPKTLHPLKGLQVSIATRIAKVVDVYEALTGYRPYRDSISPVRAYRTMVSMGDHFDQALLHRFIRVMGFFPVGSFVELEGGDVAVVEEQTGDLEHPVVEVQGRFVGKNGDRTYERCDPLRLDPREVPDGFCILRGFEESPDVLASEAKSA